MGISCLQRYPLHLNLINILENIVSFAEKPLMKMNRNMNIGNLIYTWSQKDFKGTVVNRALESLHGGSLNITLTISWTNWKKSPIKITNRIFKTNTGKKEFLEYITNNKNLSFDGRGQRRHRGGWGGIDVPFPENWTPPSLEGDWLLAVSRLGYFCLI